MSLPVEFGRRYTLSNNGELTHFKEEIFVNSEAKKTHTVVVETVRVKDDKAMHVEFLKLLDRYKKGEIDLPGIQMLRDKNSGSLRVEKSWVDLQ
jgi:hypothetical protein